MTTAVNIVFRTDASISIGTGHVMRCLTLADVLKRRGADCHFVCAKAPGDAIDFIRLRGHTAHGLSAVGGASRIDPAEDAAQTRAIISALHPEWMIVDHYQLGQEWESQIRTAVKKLLVIDDIGRAHRCDVLLDQNFRNPTHARYRQTLADGVQLLLGSEFALLRPEFATIREQALRRRQGELTRILVSLGGSDPGNETCKVLEGLQEGWQSKWALDVVVGGSNPHLSSVSAVCRRLSNTSLHVQAANMADLMLSADCAITAGGSTTWERCCLGLPALVAVVSNDQLAIAETVAAAGAQVLLGWDSALTPHDYAMSIAALSAVDLRGMSRAGAAICDGLGAERVAAQLH